MKTAPRYLWKILSLQDFIKTPKINLSKGTIGDKWMLPLESWCIPIVWGGVFILKTLPNHCVFIYFFIWWIGDIYRQSLIFFIKYPKPFGYCHAKYRAILYLITYLIRSDKIRYVIRGGLGAPTYFLQRTVSNVLSPTY